MPLQNRRRQHFCRRDNAFSQYTSTFGACGRELERLTTKGVILNDYNIIMFDYIVISNKINKLVGHPLPEVSYEFDSVYSSVRSERKISELALSVLPDFLHDTR